MAVRKAATAPADRPWSPAPIAARASFSKVKNMQIDEQKLHALLGLMVNELGAAQNAALVIIGDELGL